MSIDRIVFTAGGVVSNAQELYPNRAGVVAQEYEAIKGALSAVLGGDNLVLVPFNWPRDRYSVLQKTPNDPQIIIANSDFYFSQALPSHRWSSLGEGGAVLSSGGLVLYSLALGKSEAVGKFDWEMYEDIDLLREKGFGVVGVPDMSRLPLSKRMTHATHIDSHLSLITNEQGDRRLFVSRSYYETIARSLEHWNILMSLEREQGIRIKMVDDNQLPPFALNMLQMPDHRVIMTAGASSLEQMVRDFAKSEVVTTSIPIVEIPRLFEGSIRCTTNTEPEDLAARALLLR